MPHAVTNTTSAVRNFIILVIFLTKLLIYSAGGLEGSSGKAIGKV